MHPPLGGVVTRGCASHRSRRVVVDKSSGKKKAGAKRSFKNTWNALRSLHKDEWVHDADALDNRERVSLPSVPPAAPVAPSGRRSSVQASQRLTAIRSSGVGG